MKSNQKICAFFKNKLIVITGGGSGLGLELASEICSYGGKVILIGRNIKRLQRGQQAILNKTAEAFVAIYSQDVSEYSAMEQLFNEIHIKYGAIHGVFVNASQVHINDFRRIPAATIQQILNTNINGAIYTAKTSLPHLDEKGAFLAFTCSIAGYITAPESSLYSASKAAIISFSKTLSLELAPRGVHVLTFSPGFFKTTFTQGATATPFLMPVESVARHYLHAVVSKQKEVIVPLKVRWLLPAWKYITAIFINTGFSTFATMRMHQFYGQGQPNLDTNKESLIQDRFGFRHLISGFSFNKRVANFLHDQFGVKR